MYLVCALFTGEGDDGMDSFIDHDMEDDIAAGKTSPGSATKKRRGKASYGFSAGAKPQAAIQPGATPIGEAFVLSSSNFSSQQLLWYPKQMSRRQTLGSKRQNRVSVQ